MYNKRFWVVPLVLIYVLTSGYGALKVQKVDVAFYPYVTLSVSGEPLTSDQVCLYENNVQIEPIVDFTSYDMRSQKPLDLVFVYDFSWSMRGYLESFQSGLSGFIAELKNLGYDTRLSWVGFAAEVLHIYPNTQGCDPPPEFTSDLDAFEDYLSKVMTEGKIPIGFEECQIQALYEASKFNFRENAVKLIVLFTDEDTQDDLEGNLYYLPDLKEQIDEKGLVIVPVFSQEEPDPIYDELALFSGGKSYPFIPNEVISDRRFAFGAYFWEFLRSLAVEQNTFARITYYSPGKFGERTGALRHCTTQSEAKFSYHIPETANKIQVFGVDTRDSPIVTLFFSPGLGEATEGYQAEENGENIDFARSVHITPYQPDRVDLVLIVDLANSSISYPAQIQEHVATLIQYCEDIGISLRLGAVIPLDQQILYQDLTENLDQVANLFNRYLKVKTVTNTAAIPEMFHKALNYHYRANSQKAIVFITDAFQNELRKGFESGGPLIDAIVATSLKNNIGLFFISQKNDYIDYINRMTPGTWIGFGEKPTHQYLNGFFEDFFRQQQALTYESRAFYQFCYDPSFFTLSKDGKRLFIQFFQFSDLSYQTRLQINTVTSSPAILGRGETTLLTCHAYPPKNIFYYWECADGSFVSPNGVSEITWKAPEKIGPHNIYVEVSLGQIKMKGSVVVTVQP